MSYGKAIDREDGRTGERENGRAGLPTVARRAKVGYVLSRDRSARFRSAPQR